MKKPRFSAVAICLCLLLLLPACGGQTKKKARGPRTVPVTVVRAQRQDAPYSLSAVGNVTPLATVEVKPRVGGIIEKQLVRDGQEVRQGDLLFRIDPRPFQLALRETQARLEGNRALLNKAREDLKRYSTLRKLNVVAQEQYDNTYAEAISLENTIRLNQATMERARLDLEFTDITAPISGRVGIIQVNEGNVVKANDDRTLCVINQIQPINVSFSLPERHLSQIMAQRAKGPLHVMVAPTGTTDRVPAEVTAVDNSVDTATGTIRLVATYPNHDNRFWPGQFARVQLTLRTLKGVLLLPTAAIQPGLEGPYVYVVTPDKDDPTRGTATDRRVTTSFIIGEQSVVESGVKEGELVVLDGQVGLSPGARVEIKQTKKPAQGAEAAQ